MKPAIFGAIVLYMQMACSTEQPSFSESRTSSRAPKSGDANASGGEGDGGEIIVGSAGNDGGGSDGGGASGGDADGVGGNGATDSDGGADSGGVDAGGIDAGAADAGGADAGGADAGGADAGGMDAGDAGDAGDDDGGGNGNEEITPPEDVIMNCANGVQKTKVVPISFPARQDCSWGTKQDGLEVLSANGNLSTKDSWIRAREEQSAIVSVPANSLLCSIDMNSNTNTIHFDDFFALRIENFVVAASKVLANALATDTDGHYVWDWPRIRGNGNAGSGTQMQDIGKYCGTGDCALPEHDMPGNFGVGFALDGSSAGMNAKLFSKLSNLTDIKFTTTATGDNDAQDCFHSGGAFTVTLKYVDKPN